MKSLKVVSLASTSFAFGAAGGSERGASCTEQANHKGDYKEAGAKTTVGRTLRTTPVIKEKAGKLILLVILVCPGPLSHNIVTKYDKSRANALFC